MNEVRRIPVSNVNVGKTIRTGMALTCSPKIVVGSLLVDSEIDVFDPMLMSWSNRFFPTFQLSTTGLNENWNSNSTLSRIRPTGAHRSEAQSCGSESALNFPNQLTRITFCLLKIC